MIRCYFDGSCEPVNPYGSMGLGAVIYKDNEILFEHSEVIPESKKNSNNVAEYLSLKKILEWIINNKTIEKQIFVYGDSQLVINQMNYKWRIKHGMYKDYALKCREILSKINDRKIIFKWIPRELNQYADDLSKPNNIKQC